MNEPPYPCTVCPHPQDGPCGICDGKTLGDMIWITREGKKILYRELRKEHLKNILNLIERNAHLKRELTALDFISKINLIGDIPVEVENGLVDEALKITETPLSAFAIKSYKYLLEWMIYIDERDK